MILCKDGERCSKTRTLSCELKCDNVDFFYSAESPGGRNECLERKHQVAGWTTGPWTLLIYLCISELCCRPLHLAAICVTPLVLFSQSPPPPKSYQLQRIPPTSRCSVIYSSVHTRIHLVTNKEYIVTEKVELRFTWISMLACCRWINTFFSKGSCCNVLDCVVF